MDMLFLDNTINNELDTIKKMRYEKFERYLKTHDFDQLLYRIILEHNSEWLSYCWYNGKEAYPNNKLKFIIDYIFDNTKPVCVPELNKEYVTSTRLFKGYYFQLVYGEYVCTLIYNASDNMCLLKL